MHLGAPGGAASTGLPLSMARQCLREAVLLPALSYPCHEGTSLVPSLFGSCLAPACLQKISTLLQRHNAAVGDVLLLAPLGPGRIAATLLRSDSEVRRAAGRLFTRLLCLRRLQDWRQLHSALES